MFFKTIRVVFIFISSIIMLRFALPKLQAMEVSVKTFTWFSKSLPINAELFMYFTGLVELIIAILLISSLFIKKIEYKNILQVVGFTLLFCTMSVALIMEYFVRVAPVPFLVTIAFVLITISISELSILSLNKEIKNDKK